MGRDHDSSGRDDREHPLRGAADVDRAYRAAKVTAQSIDRGRYVGERKGYAVRVDGRELAYTGLDR